VGTRLYNGGTQPLVPAGRWGDGVIMPGEWIEVDDPGSYGPPWRRDDEVEGESSPRAPEAAHGPEVAREPPPGLGPDVRVLDNGDVVSQAGQVVGHIDTQAPAASAEGGTA